MNEPGESSRRGARQYLSPGNFIEAARRADPNFRYALVAAGLISIVSIIAKFGVNFATLAFGTIALVALMVLYLVFRRVTRLRTSSMDWPALILVWSVMCTVIAILSLLITSTFFDWPLPFKSWIVQHLEMEPRPEPDPITNDTYPDPHVSPPQPLACKSPDPPVPGEVGWVFYGVQRGKPTADGRLVPPKRAPMVAFDAIKQGDLLEAMEPVRMYDGPGRNNRLVGMIEGGKCVRALSGRKLFKKYGTYSSGWVCSQEAECPADDSAPVTKGAATTRTEARRPQARRSAAIPKAEPRDAGSQNCTISNTTNSGTITQNCSR